MNNLLNCLNYLRQLWFVNDWVVRAITRSLSVSRKPSNVNIAAAISQRRSFCGKFFRKTNKSTNLARVPTQSGIVVVFSIPLESSSRTLLGGSQFHVKIKLSSTHQIADICNPPKALYAGAVRHKSARDA